MISVVVTVGPNPVYRNYLDECLESIESQLPEGGEIVLVDDAAHLPIEYRRHNYVKLSWNLGQAAAINLGCARASHNWICIMGGSDDKLLPGFFDEWLKELAKHTENYACYHPTIITSDGVTSTLAQGIWIVHKTAVWAYLGGYPVEAGIGEVDAIFGSVMIKQGVNLFHFGDRPLYWHREHDQALTHTKSQFRIKAAGVIRHICTTEWKKPEWVTEFIKEWGEDDTT